MSAWQYVDEPCPDCGAKIRLRTFITRRDGGLRVTLDEDDAVKRMIAHVEFNTDIHPSFTLEEQDG